MYHQMPKNSSTGMIHESKSRKKVLSICPVKRT